MTTENKTVWLIGENNPYQCALADPEVLRRYALYPEPENSAGGRMCRFVLGMKTNHYLALFERRNLLHQEKWSVPVARESARRLAEEISALPVKPAAVVLLGAKVAMAWPLGERFAWRPFTEMASGCGCPLVLLPHPSGRCREWNDPQAPARARAALLAVAPHLGRWIGEVR